MASYNDSPEENDDEENDEVVETDKADFIPKATKAIGIGKEHTGKHVKKISPAINARNADRFQLPVDTDHISISPPVITPSGSIPERRTSFKHTNNETWSYPYVNTTTIVNGIHWSCAGTPGKGHQPIEEQTKSGHLPPSCKSAMVTSHGTYTETKQREVDNNRPNLESSYYKDGKKIWPHTQPSVKQMVDAGLQFIGHNYSGMYDWTITIDIKLRPNTGSRQTRLHLFILVLFAGCLFFQVFIFIFCREEVQYCSSCLSLFLKRRVHYCSSCLSLYL